MSKLASPEGITIPERDHAYNAVHMLSLGFSAPAWAAAGGTSWSWVQVFCLQESCLESSLVF